MHASSNKFLSSSAFDSVTIYFCVTRYFVHMTADITALLIALVAVLTGTACNSKLRHETDAPVRIIATDTGFDAPDKVPAGLRHIVFENHGSQIHEGMLVKLPQGMR